jgi:hypothetical protein
MVLVGTTGHSPIGLELTQRLAVTLGPVQSDAKDLSDCSGPGGYRLCPGRGRRSRRRSAFLELTNRLLEERDGLVGAAPGRRGPDLFEDPAGQGGGLGSRRA